MPQHIILLKELRSSVGWVFFSSAKLLISQSFLLLPQAYKQWILKTIEDTWSFFYKKFISLWNEHKDGNGEAYLFDIYKKPDLWLLAQKKYMDDLFHDSLGFGAAKMIRWFFLNVFTRKLY